jgi:hypothetical protein
MLGRDIARIDRDLAKIGGDIEELDRHRFISMPLKSLMTNTECNQEII